MRAARWPIALSFWRKGLAQDQMQAVLRLEVVAKVDIKGCKPAQTMTRSDRKEVANKGEN